MRLEGSFLPGGKGRQAGLPSRGLEQQPRASATENCGASGKAKDLGWFTPGEDGAQGTLNGSCNFGVRLGQFGMDRCGNGLRIILFVIPRRFPISPQIRKWPLLKAAGKEPFLSSRVDLKSTSGCFREHKEGMGEPTGFMIWSMFVLPHPHTAVVQL